MKKFYLHPESMMWGHLPTKEFREIASTLHRWMRFSPSAWVGIEILEDVCPDYGYTSYFFTNIVVGNDFPTMKISDVYERVVHVLKNK